jgi:hypothetical protein
MAVSLEELTAVAHAGRVRPVTQAVGATALTVEISEADQGASGRRGQFAQRSPNGVRPG